MMSIFAIIILLMLGAAVSTEYRRVAGVRFRCGRIPTAFVATRTFRAHTAACCLSRATTRTPTPPARAASPPRCAYSLLTRPHPLSLSRFLGKAWKGDPENPISSSAAAKNIFLVAGIYACFLGASSARPSGAPQRRGGVRACVLRESGLHACRLRDALRCGACPARTLSWFWLTRGLRVPRRRAVMCFMGHAAKRKIMPAGRN
jgi:hypothetical protein